MSRLRYLLLSRNDLSGSIPTELGQLTNLKALYLYMNSLSGSIPSLSWATWSTLTGIA